MNKQTFKSFQEAQAFYNTKSEEASVTFCDFSQNKDTKEWTVRWEESKKECTVLDVYKALLDNAEGGNMVYLDNINLNKLGITERQFSGFCSALTKLGKYQPVDQFFGRVIED